MRTLFMLIVISTILACISLIVFFSNFRKNEPNKVKRIILGYLFPIISTIFITCVSIYLFNLNFWYPLLYLVIVASLFLALILLKGDEGEVLIIPGIFIALAIIGLLFIKLDSTEKELPKQVITLYDFTDETKLSNKVIIIELSTENNEAKSYVIKTYTPNNSDLEFPLYYDNSIEYEIISSGNSRLEISSTQITKTTFFDYFEISKPNVKIKNTYKLYIKQEDILYN